MLRPWSFLPCLFALSCAKDPLIQSELPLKRVVIYRNGVGYFERSGRVDRDQVSFEMQQRTVGDFLASLAIVERGGSSVRSASFPLEVEDAEPPEGSRPQDRHPPSPQKPNKPDHGREMRKVVLHLDGEEHDLTVGYLAETPVWRPSYRVVIQSDGSADLQAWGIVQNLSGEDWRDVRLSLVAGAPLAFQSTLGQPVVPVRPVVSDAGEIIAAVPQGVTSLNRSQSEEDVDRVGPDPEPPEEADEALAEQEDGMAAPAGERAEAKRASPKSARGRAGDVAGAGLPQGAATRLNPVVPPPPASPSPSLSPPRSLADLARVALESGATRYDIPKVVTLPNQSASMVLLTSQRVPGESVFLYAPDPGVRESVMHPFRVARFTNSTAGLLERGPIAVFERGSFLGQGLLEPLPPKATATVPFALERSIGVTLDQRGDSQGARLYRIEAGQLFVEHDWVTRTLYKIDMGGNQPSKLLVRHQRRPGTRLFKPPAGTEDNVASSTALIPVSLRPHSKLELTVDERQASHQVVDWASNLADLAIKEYLADPKHRSTVADTLKEAWVIRDKLRGATDQRSGLQKEQRELERSANETRASLRAIQKNTQAEDLRATLTKRLGEITHRLEQITKPLIELDLNISELEIRFRDAIREIRIDNSSAAKS